MLFKNLKRLEKGMMISIPTDDDGLVGRECPNQECLGYFKIKFGTGLSGEIPCHCPYCGYTNDHSKFWTPEQLKYAESVAMQQINQALSIDMKEWSRRLERETRNSFLKMKVDYKPGVHPIRYYREKELETHITCNKCTLEYAIYGIFAFCPDCGEHNSYQILQKNFELVLKELKLSNEVSDEELKKKLLEDALENCISAFDAFGRKVCSIFSAISNNPDKAKSLSFQSIDNTREKLTEMFQVDISTPVSDEEWDLINRYFKKRHLLAHKLGVVDEKYISITNDPEAVLNRKINISRDDVEKLIPLLDKIGSYLLESFQKMENKQMES